jgi:hypothetical protein
MVGRSMGGKASRPRWLRKAGDEWVWAYRYMQQTPEPIIQISLKYAIRGREPSYEVVTDAIAHLQESRDGLEFVTRLRNALRQHRHRSLNADKKRKPYSFTLPTETKRALSLSAKKLKKTETALLNDLLNGAKTFLEEHEKREQLLRDELNLQRKRTKQVDDRWKAQHSEAMRQVKRLATRLSMWELSLGQTDPSFDGDQATLQSETEKKTREVEKAISTVRKMHMLIETRLI